MAKRVAVRLRHRSAEIAPPANFSGIFFEGLKLIESDERQRDFASLDYWFDMRELGV